VKTIALAFTLAAALARPAAASAETQTRDVAPAAAVFLIVDAESGRTLATLIPVARQAVARDAFSSPRSNPARVFGSSAPAPLTFAQIEAARLAAQREQFYTPPDAGSRTL
jgi:hypothetical protein